MPTNAKVVRFINRARRGDITTGTAVLTLTTGTFVAGDVGRRVVVAGAGAAGADLVTTISAFTSGTSVTLADNAGTTVVGAVVDVTMLDLNTTTGFRLMRGLDMGSEELQQESVGQAPFAGEYITSSKPTNKVLGVPVELQPQANWAALQALWDALRAELRRTTNVLEVIPMADGAASSFYDTYRSPVPAIFDGSDQPPPDNPYWLRKLPFYLRITAHPIPVGPEL